MVADEGHSLHSDPVWWWGMGYDLEDEVANILIKCYYM
jgi:hypothetical protein